MNPFLKHTTTKKMSSHEYYTDYDDYDDVWIESVDSGYDYDDYYCDDDEYYYVDDLVFEFDDDDNDV